MLTFDDLRVGLDNPYALFLAIVIAAFTIALATYQASIWLYLRFGPQERVEPKPTYPPDDVRAALDHLRTQRGHRP